MYRVDRNNFHKNKKKSNIYTPFFVSKFLFDIISPYIKKGIVFDPCVGKGSLLKFWNANNYKTIGIDIKNHGYKNTIIKDYIGIKINEISYPALVIINPPFNISEQTKLLIKNNTKYKGRPLLPEIWLNKTIELFGSKIPMVLFTPYGLRLNLTLSSPRWKSFINGTYPEISSIISLPKDLFNNILFHSEILCFNMFFLKPHYFLYSY